jgi:mRNA-degrading endonuclease toxin of MazEF toxin-antitoxin module
VKTAISIPDPLFDAAERLAKRLRIARSQLYCRASVITVSQLVTLDKSFLVDRVTTIAPARVREVEDGLRLVLSL